MRLQRPWQRLGSRGDVNHDCAAQVDAREVVDAALGDVQTVADEHQRRLERRRGIGAHADVCVFTEHQRFRFAVSDQRKARLVFEQPASLELDWLNVAGEAGGLQSGLLKLRCHVIGGAFVRRAPRVPPFHAVVGERLDMRPPLLAGVFVAAQADRSHREHERNSQSPAHGLALQELRIGKL